MWLVIRSPRIADKLSTTVGCMPPYAIKVDPMMTPKRKLANKLPVCYPQPCKVINTAIYTIG